MNICSINVSTFETTFTCHYYLEICGWISWGQLNKDEGEFGCTCTSKPSGNGRSKLIFDPNLIAQKESIWSSRTKMSRLLVVKSQIQQNPEAFKAFLTLTLPTQSCEKRNRFKLVNNLWSSLCFPQIRWQNRSCILQPTPGPLHALFNRILQLHQVPNCKPHMTSMLVGTVGQRWCGPAYGSPSQQIPEMKFL